HTSCNCSVLPRAVRLAWPSSVEQPADWVVSVQQDPLPLEQAVALTKRSTEDVPLASGRRAKRRGAPGLSTRVDQLSKELAQMKALLQSLRADGGHVETSPPEQGGSSNFLRMMLFQLRPQAPFFERPFWSWAPEPQVWAPVPLGELQGNRCLRLLERLWAVCSWMFPQASLLHLVPSLGVVMPRPPFVVPPSAEYVQELHGCWMDTRAFSRPTVDDRALAAMHKVPKFGLGCIPPDESAIASLIVPPDEALRPNACCPRPQCRVTDDLLGYPDGPDWKLTLPSNVGPLLFFGVGSLG
ncbi:hypothetical protein GOODEAATRI_032017, partial [Goodea atripinnis]